MPGSGDKTSREPEDLSAERSSSAKDPHSYSNPAQCKTTHIHIDLQALFEKKALEGSVTLTLETGTHRCERLILDTRDLIIHKAETSDKGDTFAETNFELGPSDPILGSPLAVVLKPNTTHVRISYSTTPEASGLQWLEPEQTATKKFPFLFAQSQAIHARSWIPLQDTPGIRTTFSARIQAPSELRAVMGAERVQSGNSEVSEFRMSHPIPAYLIALAIGRLEFAETGPRTGVFAEPPLLESAALEFDDTEEMIRAAERLYGPYRWGRFDLLVLPPSFPFGGMENPCVAFITPTLISGDKSLVSLISHELAHSWSGNLVTNATWSDFWLNEGFTTYIERRIQESVYGEERAEMEEALARHTLDEEMTDLEPRDQVLHVDLNGRDPDEGCTSVPYVKGALFLTALEQSVGRQRFDEFLKDYFDHFAFQSITTAQALDYLNSRLLTEQERSGQFSPEEWVFKPGIPASAPEAASEAFRKIDKQAHGWLKGQSSLNEIPTNTWSALEWMHFLDILPEDLSAARMRELDEAYHLTDTRNNEILQKWLLMAVRNDYRHAFPRLNDFLTGVGRRKFVKPLYEALVMTSRNRKLAESIYARARSSYHPVTRDAIEQIMQNNELVSSH